MLCAFSPAGALHLVVERRRRSGAGGLVVRRGCTEYVSRGERCLRQIIPTAEVKFTTLV